MLKINKYYIHLPDSENKNLEKYIYCKNIGKMWNTINTVKI